jgi:hypothetical protein
MAAAPLQPPMQAKLVQTPPSLSHTHPLSHPLTHPSVMPWSGHQSVRGLPTCWWWCTRFPPVSPLHCADAGHRARGPVERKGP